MQLKIQVHVHWDTSVQNKNKQQHHKASDVMKVLCLICSQKPRDTFIIYFQ